MSQPSELEGEIGPVDLNSSTPRHGFQGDRGTKPFTHSVPLGLSIALSREAGARGGTIARLVGQKLGWQVYDQELLEYMAQDGVARQGLLDGLPEAGSAWVQNRLAELHRSSNLGKDHAVENIALVILALSVQGEIVLIGRGAGVVLPRVTTLNVRIIAPLSDRIAYMGQWLRLSSPEARDKVHLRDDRRAQYLLTHFGKSPGELHQYDLILNSTQFGEDRCAELIAQAARLRWEIASSKNP